jgi:hypothetical protein
MAHFAQLDENNVIIRVIVVNNDTVDNLPFPESEPIGIAFCQSLFGDDTIWKQTSYNGNFRKNFAALSHSYDLYLDAFVSPKPDSNPSWVFNLKVCRWIPPIPYPSDGKNYYWDEQTVSWVEIIPKKKDNA